jgi:hypothetical protein
VSQTNQTAATRSEENTTSTVVATNARGIRYALKREGETWGVWKLCKNYAGHVRGGISNNWRYVQRHMSRADAVVLFNRRAGTKVAA